MSKIRVLIVDDAVVIRKILSDVLSSDDDIEVVGTAANGNIAIQKITQVNPDVITLDIEMPELNGIETLKKIRETHPRLPIIMFSTLTERGARATLDALAAGASDYVTKPANVGSVTAGKQAVRDELCAKIRSLAHRVIVSSPSPAEARPVPSLPRPTTSLLAPRTTRMIVIGVSTGGPNALAKVIPALPGNLPAPVLIVQHMPPMFTRLLAERLNAQSALKVCEAEEGMSLEAGSVYIAPGDFHLEPKSSGTGLIARLHQGPPENSCRPAADVLFRSAAQLYGKDLLAVVLTGMGKDGLVGCQLVKEKGGAVIAQDQQSSVVWGMPGFVVEAGLADEIVPLDTVAERIARIAGASAAQPFAAPQSSVRL